MFSLAQIRPKGNARSVVVADSGHLTQLRDGSRVVTLNKGTFEGTALLRDFRITDFRGELSGDYYHQAVALDPNDTDQMDMRTL